MAWGWGSHRRRDPCLARERWRRPSCWPPRTPWAAGARARRGDSGGERCRSQRGRRWRTCSSISLGAGHRAVLEAAGTELLFAEERIYIVALAGFVVFYGLEHMVHTARARGREHAGEGAGDRLLGRILASSS